MKETDLVSIVIPVYNAQNYLFECIESVIAQTYKNIEIICVNDGSTDKSLSLLMQLSKCDDRIKIINQNNAGVTVARKNGVLSSTGKWIVFSDADDIMPKNAIELLIGASQGYEIVIGQVEFIGNYKWPYLKENRVWTKRQSLKRIITGSQHCGPVSKLFLKMLFDESTFNIPDDIVLGEDKIMNYNLFTNVSNGKKIRQIPDVVYKYIQRPTYHPSNKENRKKRMKIECSILKRTSIPLVLLRKFYFFKEELKSFLKRFVR